MSLTPTPVPAFQILSKDLAQQERDKISKYKKEVNKKEVYKKEVQRFNAPLAPFALSSDGLLASQADRTLQQIAAHRVLHEVSVIGPTQRYSAL